MTNDESIYDIRIKEMKGLITYSDMAEQRAKYIVEDVNRILSERDEKECKYSDDDMVILDFTDFQEQHAELHNVKYDWWLKYVCYNYYLETYAQENDNVLIIEWSTEKKKWEECESDEDGEYNQDDTVIVQMCI